MMRWLEVGEYVDRSPTLLGRAWRLVLVTIAALLGALIGGPIGWMRRQWRRHRSVGKQTDDEAPRSWMNRVATLAVYLGFLRYSKLGEWIANRRRRSSR